MVPAHVFSWPLAGSSLSEAMTFAPRHPHVTGQPFRMRALREFLEYAKGLEGVWWTTREEIATWYLENHLSHIG